VDNSGLIVPESVFQKLKVLLGIVSDWSAFVCKGDASNAGLKIESPVPLISSLFGDFPNE
ncbi:MAG: hypothetical protein WAV47_10290, partial [Blastocatellia bacterium]